MNLTKITAVALALLVVGAGAAAAIPGHAADQAQDHANDDASGAGDQRPDDAGPPADAGNASDAGANANVAGANANVAGANESDAADRRGPPTDLPEQVPDHVSQIHSAINDWLDSDKEGSLGDRISDIVGGDDEGDESGEDATDESGEDDTDATATETGTESGQ